MRRKLIASAFALFVALVVLVACDNAQLEAEELVVRNFVDERYELVALVFRLAGRPEFDTRGRNYHTRLANTFSDFADHPVVVHTATFNFGYDAVLNMAVNLRINDDGITLEEGFHNVNHYGRWNRRNSEIFVDLLNDFYIETNFAQFFADNEDYFMSRSRFFVQNVYSHINLEWFEQFDLHRDNLRIIISPAITGGYAAYFFDNEMQSYIVYAAVQATSNFTHSWYHDLVIHEFSHTMGNPLAAQWMRESGNPLISWSFHTLRSGQMIPGHAVHFVVAYEYVTRAFEILYFVDNTERSLDGLFTQHRAQGFGHIAEVFNKVMYHIGR